MDQKYLSLWMWTAKGYAPDFLSRLIWHHAQPYPVSLFTHSPIVRIRNRGLVKRSGDYTDRVCGRGCMRRNEEKILTKVVSHFLKPVTAPPPPPTPAPPMLIRKDHAL
jgi:hypothetical protein